MALIRRWTFGKFQSQHDEIHAAELGFGRSIIVEGSDTNQDQSTYNYDSVDQEVRRSSGDTNFIYSAMEFGITLIKAQLGQIPVLMAVDLSLTNYSAVAKSGTIEVWRFINQPQITDCTNRYRDKSELVTWYEDVYAPFPGRDLESEPTLSTTISVGGKSRATLAVKPIVERALRDNINVSLMLRQPVLDGENWQWSFEGATANEWPYMEFAYAYPIEFYESDLAGDIDLTSVVDDTPGHEYYLGAVERGQTGSPVKAYFRNYTSETKQVEIFDDHPEQLVAIQRDGTGTGQLDYVVLVDNAVSQLYTAVFYSATQYEIKAEAYRDNEISLHPQINADSSWRGSVGVDFTAPSGGLSIPAAAWQPGTATDDEIEVGVRGNTTNTDWPADGNDQVLMTEDDAGNPDNLLWRPITGRRVLSAAAVTIDATTKLIPTAYVDPSDWPIGTPAFIHNAGDFDAGQIKSVQAASIGTPVFSGSGTDDLTVSGNHNGPITDDYVLEIDAGGTPGTFQWSNDGGSTQQATGVVPTGSPQLLENGIYVTIPTGTAHTLADTWTIPVEAFAVELEALTSGSTAYGPGAIVGTTLPFRDVAPAVFAITDEPSGASEAQPARIYLESTVGFVAGDQVKIEQTVGSDPLNETGTIAGGGVQTGYIDLTAALTNDYAAGSFVTKENAGNNAFWLKIDADPSTIEQLKSFRLNARIL